MKTQYYTASSLDGFIATEDDSLEWLFSLPDLNDSSYPGFIADVGALAMGSATYEWIVRNSDTVAAGEQNIWIVGGGDLAGQFHDAGLLDELIIQIGSVTLGRGKQLFPRRVLSPTLRLVSVHQMGCGMVELRYQVRR